MSTDGQIKFGFCYRITQFMSLVVDDVENMESETLTQVAEWMMSKIRGRVCPFRARFSIDEEDEVEVDDITVGFLFDLLRTCQKRGMVERVDFEMEGEPRTICWKQHFFVDEQVVPESPKESPIFESNDVEFDAGFIEFLRKLEKRQEMIKESALRLLSPPRPCVFAEQKRTEKSVQTSTSFASLPAEAFVPELPPPDLADFHDPQLDLGSVDHFVDALFDFEPKIQRQSSNAILTRYPAPRFLSSRGLTWPSENSVSGWNKPTKITMPWTVRSMQQVNSLRGLNAPSNVEDLISVQETTAIAHRIQKKWDRLHGEAGLSMTAALSTGVGGTDEKNVPETVQPEKKSKKRENEEWMAALLKMLEQKPAKSRKLLKGLINFSKEHHKSSKRQCRVHNVTPTKNSDSEAPREESGEEQGPVVSKEARPTVDFYEYMKMKLKEHEKLTKIPEKQQTTSEVKSKKPKKEKKEKNQNDIRSYLVGKRVAEPRCKTCGAIQTDIRDYLVGKKVLTPVENVENQQPSTVTAPVPQKEQKSSKPKTSSKSQLVGKYVKLSKSRTLAVVGESATRHLGRLSDSAVAFGKTFKLTNLSRKEMQINVVPIDWPAHAKLLHPVSPLSLAPGQTKDLVVTMSESSKKVSSGCHLLSITHRKTPLSHTLTFKVDILNEHLEGPLLSDLYTPEEVKMITMLLPIPNLPRQEETADGPGCDEDDTTETVHTVINMLKDEVDSQCSGVISQVKIEENSVSVNVEKPQHAEELVLVNSLSDADQLTDSVHTAVEYVSEECIAALKDVSVTGSEAAVAYDSDEGSDFELVDGDEGERMSYDKEDDVVTIG